MANQPDKRQQFRFWYPYWGNRRGAAASRPPAPPVPRRQPAKPHSPVQTPTPPTNQPQPIKQGTSRTTSLSPSPSPSRSSSSSSPSPSSSPAKQNQQRRIPHTPSSPLPSPTQSPSRRSPRLDQVKQNTRDDSAQGSKLPPQTTPTTSRSPSPSKAIESSIEASNKQGTTHGEQLSNKEPIEPKPLDSKTAEGNVDKPTSQASNVENEIGFNNSEEIEHMPILFDSPIGEKLAGTDIPNINHNETDEEKGQENHELEPQLGLVPSTVQEASETQTEEHDKQRQNESNQDKSIPPDHINHQENEKPKEIIKDLMVTPSPDDSPEETIKEIAKSSQDENPKETIKEIAQPTDLNDLGSNYNNKTPTTNNYSSDNKDGREIENPVTNNPKQKEKIIAGPSSSLTSVQKGIKDGISKLIRKINTENAFNRGSESATSVITLAGENKGASMYIGNHDDNEGHNGTFTGRAHRLNESAGVSTDEIEIEKDSRISANVNSNVQSINNSVLQESSCDTKDPGVHLRFSSRMKKEKMKKREDEASN